MYAQTTKLKKKKDNQSSSHCCKTVLMLMKITRHASWKMDAVRNGNVIYTNLLFGFD